LHLLQLLLLLQLVLLWLMLLWQLLQQHQLLMMMADTLPQCFAHLASQHCLQDQIKCPHSPALWVLRVIYQLHHGQPAIQQQLPELTHRHRPAAACVTATITVHAPAAGAVPKRWQLLPVWWAAGPVLRHVLHLLRLLLQLLRCCQAEADAAATDRGSQLHSHCRRV
jgi:hypothetical protein